MDKDLMDIDYYVEIKQSLACYIKPYNEDNIHKKISMLLTSSYTK